MLRASCGLLIGTRTTAPVFDHVTVRYLAARLLSLERLEEYRVREPGLGASNEHTQRLETLGLQDNEVRTSGDYGGRVRGRYSDA